MQDAHDVVQLVLVDRQTAVRRLQIPGDEIRKLQADIDRHDVASWDHHVIDPLAAERNDVGEHQAFFLAELVLARFRVFLEDLLDALTPSVLAVSLFAARLQQAAEPAAET
ncbi:MAG: hypothetical protein ACMVY4_16250 [Minwuia sp.]|uniref:hypothetical protein n=1 Tax=Minwuia sp. TaxID=2493630 RepID=UPI003A89582C